MWRRNRSQVEDDKRIADGEPRTYLPDASVHPTDARKTTVARFGRSDRSTQGLRPWPVEPAASLKNIARHPPVLRERLHGRGSAGRFASGPRRERCSTPL